MRNKVSVYRDVSGGYKKINFPRKIRRALTVESVVALIIAVLRVVFDIDVPVDVATALIVVIGWIVGLFTDPNPDERPGYELDGRVHLFTKIK